MDAEIYDVVGIGFGPANLALAIAFEEHTHSATRIFFERQASLGWHRDMLLPSAKMQVSFLKDLVTFRNPTSKFSFVSYLHAKGRLASFVNKQDFFPTRQEFHDYLEWAESALADRVTYDAEALAIRPSGSLAAGAPADCVGVEVRMGGTSGTVSTVLARNVVISTGLEPWLPPGVESGGRVLHSSGFLSGFGKCDRAGLRRVAVIGAGQSAAEVARFLYDTLPTATVYAIMTSYGYPIADNTPFANQIFDPAAVETYYHGSPSAKDAFWRYHRNTNFSAVDDDVIADLYRRAYDDEVSGGHRLRLVNLSRVVGVTRIRDGVRVAIHSLSADQAADLTVDLVVCATGYKEMAPGKLLSGLDAYCLRDSCGRYVVERDYRLAVSPLRCGIYLQGGTERSHGLSSSLLSNVAVRAGQIADSIAARTPHQNRRAYASR